jgi:hypothetical protein
MVFGVGFSLKARSKTRCTLNDSPLPLPLPLPLSLASSSLSPSSCTPTSQDLCEVATRIATTAHAAAAHAIDRVRGSILSYPSIFPLSSHFFSASMWWCFSLLKKDFWLDLGSLRERGLGGSTKEENTGEIHEEMSSLPGLDTPGRLHKESNTLPSSHQPPWFTAQGEGVCIEKPCLDVWRKMEFEAGSDQGRGAELEKRIVQYQVSPRNPVL